jgi:hypothetical protein
MHALAECAATGIDWPHSHRHQGVLERGGQRIRGYYRRHRGSAFVPSNFRGAYGILQHPAAQAEAAGTLFCEWGSGFGVVACLAA